MKVTFDKAEAFEQYREWAALDKKVFKKLNMLIDNTLRSPFDGLGKPEPLKGEKSGYWSRRITHEHRLVYRVKDDTLEILSCKFHYDD